MRPSLTSAHAPSAMVPTLQRRDEDFDVTPMPITEAIRRHAFVVKSDGGG
jgi:hypothetical protein